MQSTFTDGCEHVVAQWEERAEFTFLTRLLFFPAGLWKAHFFVQQKLKRELGTRLSEHLESKARIERLGIPVWDSDISGSSDVVGLEKTS